MIVDLMQASVGRACRDIYRPKSPPDSILKFDAEYVMASNFFLQRDH